MLCCMKGFRVPSLYAHYIGAAATPVSSRLGLCCCCTQCRYVDVEHGIGPGSPLGDYFFFVFGLKKCNKLMISHLHQEIIIQSTHPHKKGPVMKNYTRHLTSFSMVIYQAKHNQWCPVNVGWENFAQLQKFQVKKGKNGQKWPKNG